jgi:hypothetical protein
MAALKVMKHMLRNINKPTENDDKIKKFSESAFCGIWCLPGSLPS